MNIFNKFNKNYQVKKWIINSIKRQNKFLKQNLFVDNIETKMKVFWLKNKNDINNFLLPNNNLNFNVCYFINSVLKFNNYDFNYIYDIIVLDLWWKVKECFQNVKPNKLKLYFNNVSHIIILPMNGINQLNIKKNSYVRPLQKIN